MMNTPPKDRASREQESREAESREQSWIPPSSLPDPHSRPSLVHRYIRTSAMGQADPVNVSNAFREGWTPVTGAEYPELKILSDPGSRYPDSIEIGGLLLCSALASKMKARTEYFSRMTQAQIKSVNDQFEAEEDPRLRTMFRDHTSKVTRGFGSGERSMRPGPPSET